MTLNGDGTTKELRIVRREGYSLTNHRALCRRGVIWLGQTCNLRCYFCYFSDRIASANHPEHPFMPLEKAKSICRTLVDVYGNNSVDIQGGEPTIYPHIHELLTYCNQIGLKPTLITNAIALAQRDVCRRLKESNVCDLLISIHGLGDLYDKIVGVPGASDRQRAALDNCREFGIPIRVNVTLTKEALAQLDEIVAFAVSRGARVVNFIAFNPFIDQSDERKRAADSIPRYRETAQRLLPLLDMLEERLIEANVRYMPFCVFPEQYRKYVQNFQQIVYDLHEWESAGEVWSGATAQRRAAEPNEPPTEFYRHVYHLREHLESAVGYSEAVPFIKRMYHRVKPMAGSVLKRCHPGMYDWALRFERRLVQKEVQDRSCLNGFSRKYYLVELGDVPGFSDLEYAYKEFRVIMPKKIHPYEKGSACTQCDLVAICDGFHRDYAAQLGFGEAEAVCLGGRVYDPRHYLVDQLKVVEEQEYLWALPA